MSHLALILSVCLALLLTDLRPGFLRGDLSEICDNGIDDDMDGMIDLNDTDCDCPKPRIPSFVPNASFENRSCCPGNSSQMYCATDWIQASVPTTDFLHKCGWLGWDAFTLPEPLPDGEGALGFRNGRPGDNGNGPSPNWKEYAGACLSQPLEIGGIYRIEFYVGFAQPQFSRPIEIGLYGTSSCDNLPFDSESASFGCPTNSRNWYELGKIRVEGANEWIKISMEMSPPDQTNAIALGPSCQRIPSEIESYYFLDAIVLNQKSAFDVDIRSEGHPCSGSISLTYPNPQDSIKYQWFHDGVAIPEQTGARLDNISPGVYQLMLKGSAGCFVTDPYLHIIPQEFTYKKDQICLNDSYEFGSQQLSRSGVYIDTLISSFGCDSIVELDLIVDSMLVDTMSAKVFENKPLVLGDYVLQDPGTYQLSFTSSGGCDSTVIVQLSQHAIFFPNAFTPNGDGQNEVFTFYTESQDSFRSRLQIFNRLGGLVFDSANESAPNPAHWDGKDNDGLALPGVYIYKYALTDENDQQQQFSGEVVLLY